MSANLKEKPKKASIHEQRVAVALRENLRKRKQQLLRREIKDKDK